MAPIVLNLLLIFLPSQLGLHFWPSWASINGLRVDYFSPTLYFTDILVILLFIFHPPRFSRWLIPIVLIAVVNIYFSLSPFVSLYKWAKVAEFAFLAYWVANNWSKLNIKHLSLSILIGVFYSAILTIWQFIAQSSIGGLWYFLGERTFTSLTPGIANAYINGQLLLRPYATFPHPNVLGGFLAVILPLILLQFPRNSRKITAVILALGYVTLFLTLSRSAILVGLLATTLVLKLRPIIVLALAVALILLFPRFSSLQFETEPLLVRTEQINLAFREFVTSPFVGTGLGTSPLYPTISNFEFRISNFALAHQPIHNIYLLLLSETGLLGLGSFLVLIFLALRNCLVISNWKLKIPLLCVLLLGLFDHYFLTLQQTQLLFAIIVGNVFSFPQNRLEHRRPDSR